MSITILLFLFLGIPSVLYTFGVDHGIYSCIGSALLDGKIIYKDIFDVKPPLTFLLYAGSFKFFGRSILAVRIFDLIWQCATAIVILFIAERFYKRKYTGIIAAFLYGLYYYSQSFLGLAQTDGFINLPLSLSILIFLISLKNNKRINWILSGFFLNTAVLFKYPIAVLFIFYSLIIMLHRSDSTINNLKKVMYVCIGFCIPSLLFVSFLFIHGIVREFIYLQFTYIFAYNLGENIGDNISKFLTYASLNPIFLLWVLLLMCEVLYVYHNKLPITSWLMIFWMIAAIFHLIIQSHYLGYHSLPMLAPGVIIGSHMVFTMYDFFQNYLPQLRNVLIVIFVFFLCVFYVHSGYISKITTFYNIMWKQRDWETYYEKNLPSDFGSMKMQADIAQYITNNSNRDDTIFIWGFDPSIYFLSGRDCASRFIYNFPIYGRFPWKQKFITELIEDLIQNKPQFILIQKHDAVAWISGTTDDSERAFKKITPFYNLVTEYYEHDKNMHHMTIYKKRW